MIRRGLASGAVRIAGYLRERGVQRGDAVVVCLPRGVEQVMAILGVLASEPSTYLSRWASRRRVAP